MDEGNLPILVDAKTEYTKQLINIISPVIYQGIKLIYNESKNKSIENEEINSCLSYFQNSLSEIPKWNQIIITEKYEKILEYSKCDWLDDLLTAVFVSHTKILTSINTNKNKNKINLQIPKVDFFIHQCYIEVAREFWKNPYLFDDSVNNFEYQRNRRDAVQIIESVIAETIRKQLPVKNILKEYLGSEYSEDVNDDIESTNNITDNLRKLVKNEIENCSKEKLSALNIEQPESISEDNSLTKEDINAFNNTNVDNLEVESDNLNDEDKKLSEILDENGNVIKINKVDNNDIKLDNIDELINSEVDKLELVSQNDFELNAKNIDENLERELSDLSKLEEVYIDEKKNIENSASNTTSTSESNESNENLISESNKSNESNKSSETLTNESNTTISSESSESNESSENLTNELVSTPRSTSPSDESNKTISKESNDLSIDTNNILNDNISKNEENVKLEINNDLSLEELNLDSLDDLNFDINNLESDNENELETNDSINTPNEDNNVKTIVIDTKQTANDRKFDNDRILEIGTEESARKKVFNKYSSKKKRDFSFFSDALIE